jgi:hypothetical protein
MYVRLTVGSVAGDVAATVVGREVGAVVGAGCVLATGRASRRVRMNTTTATAAITAANSTTTIAPPRPRFRTVRRSESSAKQGPFMCVHVPGVRFGECYQNHPASGLPGGQVRGGSFCV